MMRPVPIRPVPDEYSVDFDHYMIVYSDHTDCGQDDLDQLSPITELMLGRDSHWGDHEHASTGETTIGCYQGERFVGRISFYQNREEHPHSSADSEGRVSLWYPLGCFRHILSILHHERQLSLSLICADLDGRDITPPLGALLTWPEPTGKEAESEC